MNKQNNSKRGANKKSPLPKLLAVLGAAVCLILVLVLVLPGDEEPSSENEPEQQDPVTPQPGPGKLALDIGSGLTVTDIGNYTGMYMEDGSNELVAGVLMCIVRNDGDRGVEYAELTLNDGAVQAHFTITALLPGRSVVLLAQDRAPYNEKAEYTADMAQKVAFFASQPSLQADLLKIQGLDGGLNVTNISKKDITGDVVIYYKNVASDGLLYGGITYRTRISGGIKAGELKQGMTQHFRLGGSEVLFVTVAE